MIVEDKVILCENCRKGLYDPLRMVAACVRRGEPLAYFCSHDCCLDWVQTERGKRVGVAEA